MINEDYSLNVINFKIKDTLYRITGTCSNNKYKVEDCVDTVKNLTSGEIKKYKRKDLKLLFEKYKAEKL